MKAYVGVDVQIMGYTFKLFTDSEANITDKKPKSKSPMTNSYKYTHYTKFGKHYITSYVNTDLHVTFSQFILTTPMCQSLFHGDRIFFAEHSSHQFAYLAAVLCSQLSVREIGT
jgi:hypothetical protein